MMQYQPDRWVVIKITAEGGLTGYKVLAGWSGGYLTSDEWRVNSGITRVEEDDSHFLFYGHSGSVYKCHKLCYGVTTLSGSILTRVLELGAVLMDENTNWMEIDYE